MPRPREFNKDEVIVRAMLLFWKKGYEATSIRDLIDVMGISSSSMYEAFGDKRGVFLAALAHFCAHERARIAEMAKNAPSPEAFIQQLFGSVEEAVQAQEQPPDSVSTSGTLAGSFPAGSFPAGSLAFNTMVEFGTRDPDVTTLLLEHYYGIAQIVAEVIERGQAQGTVTSQQPAFALAYTLLSTLHGVATVKGVQPNFQYAGVITQTVVKLLHL